LTKFCASYLSPCLSIVQIGETSDTELDSIIQQVKHIKYKGIGCM